ncbi:hypothetical protein [Tabrizicola sp. M-4]|uniref:hypothetical protein n=1 Tax=Tabrizicola sp. M-4 TaxID=3055847 RepID=UPI003DA97F8F
MGLILPPRLLTAPVDATAADTALMVEASMLSQGLRIRVGADPDDLCPVEELSIGDSVWDLATHRLIDLDGMSCVTLDSASLGDLGFRPMPLTRAGGSGYLALSSARILSGQRSKDRSFGPVAFFRFWPETRLVADLEGQPVLIRPGL